MTLGRQAVLTLLVILFASDLFATMVIPLQPVRPSSLRERSVAVFKGICTEVRPLTLRNPETGDEIAALQYSFMVEEVVKGSGSPWEKGAVVLVNQLHSASRQEAIRWGVVGHSSGFHFQVGKSYLLFLRGKNALGLDSFTGDEQGIYTVERDEMGREEIKNAFGIPAIQPGVGKGLPSGGQGSGSAPTDSREYPKEMDYKEFTESLQK